MKTYKRRRFLLFATQASASLLIGSLSKCSTMPQQKTKSEKEMNELREAIIKLIKAEKIIKLKWDCGGDEALVSITIDGKEIDYNSQVFQAFDIHVINLLNLPDVGEFEMDGEGVIIEENGQIYVEYESTMKGYASYNDKYEYTGWKKVNEKDEAYSGKKELFKD